jgi:tetratricopeptide (TPR) repeat protein
MQAFQPQSGESVDEIHPDIFSPPASQNHSLLSHLQTAVPSPLDILLNQNGAIVDSVLGNVSVRPALPESPAVAKPSKVILQEGVRLSECLLWQMQSDYYSSRGIDAWKNAVPTFITSSAYIADAYAEIVLAFVEDYFDSLDLSEPLYILEMATGTGRFSHLMLKELEMKLSSFSKYKDVRFRYIMTDFTESNPQFWQQHDRLKPFIEKGLLDFAVLNPMADTSLTLLHSGEVLTPGCFKNPLIAIGNYFFDSIRQDVFRIESKVLKEGLVTLERNLEGVEEDSPPHIREIEPKFRYRDLPNHHYYKDARLNAVLNHYRHNLRSGTILFPLGAFEVIQNLEVLSGNRLILISSDKAYTNPMEMTRYNHHGFARHDGAFSYMVNYHAIGQYFLNESGRYFYTEARNNSIQTVCCMKLGESNHAFERLTYFYNQKMNRANVANTVCNIMPSRDTTVELKPPIELRQLLGHLQLGLCDAQLFLFQGQRFVDLAPQGVPAQRDDLLRFMDTVWQNYYFFPGEVNLPFWFAQIYFVLDLYEKSIEFVEHAIRYYGEHHILFYLKGQGYGRLQQWKNAQDAYLRAIALNPDFPEAREELELVERELKGKK